MSALNVRVLVLSIALTIFVIHSSIIPQTQASEATLHPRGDTGYIELCTNNCSFETGNMSGWEQSGGSFVVNSEFVRSGSYSVATTSATRASFFQTFSLLSYQSWIAEGYGTVRGSAFIDPGKSERGIVEIVFFDAIMNQLPDGWNSGEQYSAGTNWLEVANEIRIPTQARYIRISITAVRYGGDTTDMNVDDVTTRIRFVYPDETATPTITPTRSRTASKTRTFTRTLTASRTPTRSFTASATRSRTRTRTASPTRTQTKTSTNAPTQTSTRTPTKTLSATVTKTQTLTKSVTRTPTVTNTPTTTPLPSLCMRQSTEWDVCAYYTKNLRLEALVKNRSFTTKKLRFKISSGVYAYFCETRTGTCIWQSESVVEPVVSGSYTICITSNWVLGCGYLPTLGERSLYSAYYVTDPRILDSIGYTITIR